LAASRLTWCVERRSGDPREADSSASASREASDVRRGPNAFPETYFGTTEGFPPGLPGGMTGVVPGLGTGAGAVIFGSILAGGRMTPSVASSFSLRVAPEPTVPVAEGSSGFIFSGMTWLVGGMLGAWGGRIGV
jgi:hypothetical protein